MNPDPNQQPGGLQFDKAEFKESAPLQCAICKAPIEGDFYQINGQAVCPSCRNRAAAELGGGTTSSRFGLAVVTGLVAAVAGVLLYWVIALIAGHGWSIVAIAVGWMVGYAVRWASGAKGGLPYQVLAVVLTYCSIAAWYSRRYLPRAEGASLLDYLNAFGEGFMYPWSSGTSAIFLWVIIAFALHQAWSMNHAVHLQITGPFSARQSTPPPAT